jgi:phage-related protein
VSSTGKPQRLRAVSYRDQDGSEPASDFTDALPVKQQVVLDNQIDRINERCTTAQPDLPFPHSSQVDGQLRELRCHYGRSLYRVLYRRSGNLVILLHPLSKTTAQIPASEIKIAKERWADFEQRMEALNRKRPRAIGGDAPEGLFTLIKYGKLGPERSAW